MGRPKAGILKLNCVMCHGEFETPDTKRGRKRETCSKSCASKRAYESQKVTVPCVLCGSESETAKSVINAGLPVYCEECSKARYELTCEVCGIEFMGRRASVKCCSRPCITEWNRRMTTQVICDCCGIQFERATFSVYSGKRSYCSDRCAMRQFSRENPMRYGGTWPRWVRAIRERDGYKCLVCGETGDLEVHHFIKMKSFNNPDDSHYDENLGLFCVPCHDAVEDSGIDSLTEFYRRYSPTPGETSGGRQK